MAILDPKAREALAAHYDAITDQAEALITHLVSTDKGINEEWLALGVWRLWYALTIGWQREGDSDRLEGIAFRRSPSLTNQPKSEVGSHESNT